MNRKTRFRIGFLLITFLFVMPLASALLFQSIWMLAIVLVGFLFSVYLLYRFTIKNVKPRYPLLPPEGHPDIYSCRMPRPIYEDMEQYPWLFEKKHEKATHRTKVKKKH